MFKSNFRISFVAALATACFVWAAGQPAMAQHAGHDEHAGHDHGSQHRSAVEPAAASQPGPHGGQVAAARLHTFEVVYRPREVRVYLYGSSRRPATARAAQGQVVMQVRGNEKLYRYPLKYVAPPAGSKAQDYLALAVDLSRIRDGDMNVTFELANLPNSQQPQAAFTQTFALSKTPLTVRVVALTEADRAGIARQKVCAVTGGKLGGMGTPIKVLIGEQTIYLCCKGCLGKVEKNPKAYLPSSNRITVTTATAADQAAIDRQRVCAVSGGKLGGMGTPLKVTLNGKSVFLCCKGCVGKVKKNPELYW